ncbi:MAG TPA: hypothetical protein VK922_07535 [Gemmatimonadaceae bacterium]|nr:hypothetical protein [Gemmatimonadaceae bacterium]
MAIDERKDNESFRKPDVVGDETLKDLSVPKNDAEQDEQVKGGTYRPPTKLI